MCLSMCVATQEFDHLPMRTMDVVCETFNLVAKHPRTQRSARTTFIWSGYAAALLKIYGPESSRHSNIQGRHFAAGTIHCRP